MTACPSFFLSIQNCCFRHHRGYTSALSLSGFQIMNMSKLSLNLHYVVPFQPSPLPLKSPSLFSLSLQGSCSIHLVFSVVLHGPFLSWLHPFQRFPSFLRWADLHSALRMWIQQDFIQSQNEALCLVFHTLPEWHLMICWLFWLPLPVWVTDFREQPVMIPVSFS